MKNARYYINYIKGYSKSRKTKEWCDRNNIPITRKELAKIYAKCGQPFKPEPLIVENNDFDYFRPVYRDIPIDTSKVVKIKL